MIQNTELRVGNLFMGGMDEILEVCAILATGVNYKTADNKGGGWCPFPGMKPIPLTEDWLVRLGFHKLPLNYGIQIDHEKSFQIAWNDVNKWYCYFEQSTQHDYDLVLMRNDLGYVHQLQNLYSSLCGKELEYSKTKTLES